MKTLGRFFYFLFLRKSTELVFHPAQHLIEKNINEFKYYNESSFNITVPISKLITLKYVENVKYSEDMIVLQSEHDMIEHLDKYYSLEMHLPLFELFK